jgi:hypothetical protein
VPVTGAKGAFVGALTMTGAKKGTRAIGSRAVGTLVSCSVVGVDAGAFCGLRAPNGTLVGVAITAVEVLVGRALLEGIGDAGIFVGTAAFPTVAPTTGSLVRTGASICRALGEGGSSPGACYKVGFFVIGALILCAGADVVVIGLALTGTLGFVEASNGDIGPVAGDTGRLIGTSKPANQLGL